MWRDVEKTMMVYLTILFFAFMVIAFTFASKSIYVEGLDRKIENLSSGWEYTTDGIKTSYNFSGLVGVPKNRKVITFYRDVDSDLLKSKNLIFYSVENTAEVFINNKIIYKYEEKTGNSTFWGGGSKWNVVQLPTSMKFGDTISVRFSQKYSNTFGNLPKAFYGAEIKDFFDYILKKSVISLVTVALLFMLSVVMLLFWITRKGWQNSQWDFLDLSIFVFLEVIAFSLRIPWITWVYGNFDFFQTLSMYASLIAIQPILNLSGRVGDSRHKILYKSLLVINQVYIITCMFLDITGRSWIIRDNYVDVTITTVVSGVYFWFVVDDYKHKSIYDIQKFILPTALLYLVILIDMMQIKLGISHYSSNFLGVVIFVIVMYISKKSASTLATTYKNSVDAQKYQMLSETDALTGLRNRNSYTKFLENLELNDGVGVIIMDVNNLKFVNDTMGHDEGDRMIRDVSELMKRIFKNGYELFRIGGDEFAIFSSFKPREEIERDLWYFDNEIKHMDEKKSYEFSVAFGFSMYKEHRGDTIDELINRADQNMYFKKIASKL